MQIEIDDNLVERVKNVLGGCISQEAVEGTIAMLIRDSVEKDEKKQGLAPKMFRIKTWIPVEIDPKEDVDVQYSTREAAEKEKAQLEEMQTDNIYKIVEGDVE